MATYYVLKIVDNGEYLQFYNPDQHAPGERFPTGSVVTTKSVRKAKRFPDMVAALQEWQRQSTVTPLRPDGKPNRPLTAFTVTTEKVEL